MYDKIKHLHEAPKQEAKVEEKAEEAAAVNEKPEAAAEPPKKKRGRPKKSE